MINNFTTAQAYSFATELAQRGFSTKARPGTVLSELVRISTSPVEKTTTKDSVDPWNIFTLEPNVNALHDGLMGKLIDDLGKIVTRHIGYAKNIVKPMVMDMAEKISAYQQENKTLDPASEFTISPCFLADVFSDESFLDTLRPYKDRAVLAPDKSSQLKLQALTDERLHEMVMTGSSRVDAKLVEWLSAQQPNFLKTVWTLFFTDGLSSTELVTLGQDFYGFDDASRQDAYAKTDVGLAIYLLARRIESEVQESEMSLAQYQRAVQQYQLYAGALIVEGLTKIDSLNRGKVLMLSGVTKDNVIKVNGSVYNDWLAQGGTPEVILGNSLAVTPTVSVSMIDERRKVYESSWATYCMVQRVKMQNMALHSFKLYLESTFAAMLAHQDEVEAGYMLKNTNHLVTCKKNFGEYLSTITKADVDPYAVALCGIAKCRYYFTSAYQMLSDIEEAMKQNSKLEVREAALLAAANYVSDYIADQLSITNDNVSSTR